MSNLETLLAKALPPAESLQAGAMPSAIAAKGRSPAATRAVNHAYTVGLDGGAAR